MNILSNLSGGFFSACGGKNPTAYPLKTAVSAKQHKNTALTGTTESRDTTHIRPAFDGMSNA
ncbi:MAG: hypothetical protein NC078_07915 [Ruminococcus sp.]|nr:hypothetical protein [Ruminococcus sp.]